MISVWCTDIDKVVLSYHKVKEAEELFCRTRS
jgi:hypothetical protein